MLKTRYDYMLSLVSLIKPIKIIEVGISRGIRAAQLINLSKKFNPNIEYVGYDVFDSKDENFHKLVGNGKKVLSKKEIYDYLIQFCKNVNLFEGTTEETLWGRNVVGDLVFIDGDHRIDAILKDFQALMNSKLIVLDDYYINGHYKEFDSKFYGCNNLTKSMNIEEYSISPPSLILPEIRLLFYSKDIKLIKFINQFFFEIQKLNKK